MNRQETTARRSRIAQDVSEGATVAEVARKHDVTSSTVLNACRATGLQRPSNSRGLKPSVTSFRILLEMLERPAKDAELAARLKVTQAQVHYVAEQARKAGFKIGAGPASGV